MYDKSGICECVHNNLFRPQFELKILVEKSSLPFVVSFLVLFWGERTFVKFVANIQYIHAFIAPEFQEIHSFPMFGAVKTTTSEYRKIL